MLARLSLPSRVFLMMIIIHWYMSDLLHMYLVQCCRQQLISFSTLYWWRRGIEVQVLYNICWKTICKYLGLICYGSYYYIQKFQLFFCFIVKILLILYGFVQREMIFLYFKNSNINNFKSCVLHYWTCPFVVIVHSTQYSSNLWSIFK